ncbi:MULTISPECIES: hypothetical protein [unclassified Bosea (in: a-proteobacteria)]|uniref:hypothetical protein n=1 Tax=unclassified Bosea (in: a-proteobacteria) TaxID=2653178 RepID=UPI00125F8A8B|nr:MULTISPECIES: hypothetical protein [unclassified Bosea (in: a-proteobacteria)]
MSRHLWVNLRAALVGAVALALAGDAQCVEAIHRIDLPLPTEFRERAATILSELRPADFQNALQNTKARWLQGPVEGETLIILRIEQACFNSGCMTILGRMTAAGIKPDLVMEAGKSFRVLDTSIASFWGQTASPLLVFQTDAGPGLAVAVRANGSVVTACNCANWAEAPQAPPPPADLPKLSFEDFTRALERIHK